VIVSAADSRLVVFDSVDAATKLWLVASHYFPTDSYPPWNRIKGRFFTLGRLLGSSALLKALGPNPSLAIFRLAPQDYHRFHAPLACTLRKITSIPGEYYTVNPQAVNEKLDVFTGNRRDVCWAEGKVRLKEEVEARKVDVAIVAVGALLVGSVGWDKKEGGALEKGEGMGYFQYGG
jgi:phosphatidylserine decarboxylase